MLRFRRYRAFLLCAMLITIALIRLLRSRQYGSDFSHHVDGGWEGYREETYDQSEGFSSSKEEPKRPPVDIESLAHSLAPINPATSATPPTSSTQVIPERTNTMQEVVSSMTSVLQTPTTLTATSPVGEFIPGRISTLLPEEVIIDHTMAPLAEEVMPDQTVPLPSRVSTEVDNKSHTERPSRVRPIEFASQPPVIHWEKQVENFPVPAESIIQLPTGAPIPIPKIQHHFSDETVIGRVKREDRLEKVKAEFKKAWNGYKKYAWMHDELLPISGGFRDPFAGWAATLVDSLDTLSIMGLDEDFEEAVRAVGNIDFTTAKRQDIQVFETTIRYLGGLLAAYDVSGQTKKILLDKAIELGEVLIGAFDTPNRMPVLYYNWKPAFASQPHRASTRSNLAELGSLAMEFTRLAQLTKEAKYYDAVARITDALFEWQSRGTTGLLGVFPQDVDTSGCNRTAPVIDHSLPSVVSNTPDSMHSMPVEGEGYGDGEDKDQGYKAQTPKTVQEPLPVKGKGALEAADIKLSVIPGEPSRANIERTEANPDAKVKQVSKRSGSSSGFSNVSIDSAKVTNLNQVLPVSLSPSPEKQMPNFTRNSLRGPTKALGTWDCVPQGLESANYGRDSFSLGGSQDSTYEYFSKQYLLLGGLEDKYRTLYLGAVNAVRDHMLYRPMVPNSRDILFSGKITRNGDTGPTTFEPEVTHLTCFLGGMFGMGAKIFGLEEHDIEIAKKLSDGCVWAYESMATGIMPESATVLRCEEDIKCQWNETMWLRALDPMADQREKQIEDYEIRKANRKAHEEQAALAAQAKLEAEEREREEKEMKSAKDTEETDVKVDGHEIADNGNATSANGDSKTSNPISNEDGSADAASNSTRDDDGSAEPASNSTRSYDVKADPVSQPIPAVQKRELDQGISEVGLEESSLNFQDNSHDDILQKKLHDTEIELQGAASGRQIKTPSKYVPQIPKPNEKGPDPERPLSHKEYVEAKIKREGLAPGFTRIGGNNYILRPEAIESVWYMYRITGDPIWQEKGWVMFEHIINATSTVYGHSAIRGVTGEFGPSQNDEMESFWLAETLKYFYLLYSLPDVISLDDWVLNTEAHPFRRPK